MCAALEIIQLRILQNSAPAAGLTAVFLIQKWDESVLIKHDSRGIRLLGVKTHRKRTSPPSDSL